MTSSSGTRSGITVLTTAGLVVAGAVIAAVMLTSRPMSGDMAGMDHGSAAVPKSAPSLTMSSEMPGMTPDHGNTAKMAPDRPLAPVLGTFGVGSSAVMLTAGLMRRRDSNRSRAREAARAARRTQK